MGNLLHKTSYSDPIHLWYSENDQKGDSRVPQTKIIAVRKRLRINFWEHGLEKKTLRSQLSSAEKENVSIQCNPPFKL